MFVAVWMQYIPEYVLMKNYVNDLENKVTAAFSDRFYVFHVHHEIIAHQWFFHIDHVHPSIIIKKHAENRLQKYFFNNYFISHLHVLSMNANRHSNTGLTLKWVKALTLSPTLSRALTKMGEIIKKIRFGLVASHV